MSISCTANKPENKARFRGGRLAIAVRNFRALLIVFGALLTSSVAMAFDHAGNKWAGATMQFHVQLSGTSLTGINWQDAFLDAIEEWNSETVFTIVPVLVNIDPCATDVLSSVDFTDDVCGTEFGANTLAVTLRRLEGQILGPANLVESDIVVNNDVEFNVYDGPIPQFGIPGLDFRRVALHELGHAIGLGHEDSNDAIMASTIGNLDRLQQDDIDGIADLYGGLSACVVKSLAYGIVNDGLSESDCRVSELTVGGQDTSFIDVYELQIPSFTGIELSMTSTSLDSVLILADADFNYIDFDDKTSGSCDSTLNRFLFPGTYYVLANTYDIPVRSDCGNTGNYSLTAGYSATSLQGLSGSSNLQGGLSTAAFRGGITASNGSSYGNVFESTQSLDIVAEIDIDPAHQGQAGFLVVAALIDGQILIQNGLQGSFQPYNPADGIPHVFDKALAAQESITIAEDLVPAELGIDAISADFVVGYGLAENPNEVYHHASPINLTVTP